MFILVEKSYSAGTVTLNPISPNIFCCPASVTVNAVIAAGGMGTENSPPLVFQMELSDLGGAFPATPTVIGTPFTTPNEHWYFPAATGTLTNSLTCPLISGTYNVRVRVYKGGVLKTTSNIESIIVGTLAVTANAGNSQTICSSGSALLAANNPSPNTGAWSIVSGPSTLVSQFSSTTNPTGTFTPVGGAGDYILRWTITDGTCSSTSDVIITATTPTIIVSPSSATICNGSSVSLTASGAVTYIWSPATGLSGSTGATVTASPATTTVYTVTGTDGDGCQNTASATVTVKPTPVTTGVTICQGGSASSLTSSSTCPNGSAIAFGPANAGTGINVTGVGTVAWTNPGNAITNNGVYATVTLSGIGTKTSNYLRTSNYNFSTIPANATIAGITVLIGRFENTGSGASTNMRDAGLRLIKAGSITGDDKANTSTDWPTSLTTATYGGTSDLWGTTWTVSDINALNFGVSLTVSSSNDRTASVDYIQISITYTVPGSLNWYTVSSGGSSIGTGSSFNPVGVAGSGLPNTNTADTYPFYAECSSVPGCRTLTNYVINPKPSISAISSSICSGTAFSVTPVNVTNGVVPAGTTYSWSAPAGTGFTGGASGSGASSISGTLINTTSNPVTAIYTVTPTTGGCTGTAFTVTVTISQITGIWQGGTIGSETDWNTASNWSCGGVPISTTDVTIPNGLTYYPIIGSANGICRTITDMAGGSISGSGSLTIAGNGVVAITNISGTATISSPVVMPATATVTVAGTLTISGVVSGVATSLSLTGSGTLVLSGTNTYDGITTINLLANVGHLNIQNGSALGTSTGGTTVNSGFLDIQGGITVPAEPLTLTANGVFQNVSGNNFWGGPITISGSTTGIWSAGNTLTITNTINLNANQLTIQGGAATVVSGVISNTGSIHKAGQGSLTLSGSNTFSGGVDLNNGQVNINNTAALGTGSLRITEGNNGNTLKIDNTSATNQAVSNTVYWNDPFLFTGTNPLTFSGSVILGSGASGTRSVNVSSATNFLTIGGPISDGGNGLGFTKLGSGTLVLTESGTYTGATTITAGELRLNPAANSTAASQFVLNGAILSTTNITTGRTFTSSSTLQLSDNSTLNLGANSHMLTFANSSGVGWTADKILTINGWTGPPGGPGTAGRIFFGTSTGTLLSSQLAEIKFSGYPGVPKLLPSGELVPASDANLTITGTPTDFGSLCIGVVSTPVTYTITNTNATATGVTVTSNNAQFVVSGLSSTTIIGDGGTATFVVTFTPSGSGSQSATITVSSDESNSPTITLTGTGLSLPVALILNGSTICTSPGGNGTITSTTSAAGVHYQLYDSSNALVQASQAGTGSGLTWSLLPAGTGYYVIATDDVHSCISPHSNTADVGTYTNPVALSLTGSTICTSPGGNGTITSTTSASGINYQLYNTGGTPIGSVQAGTGSGLTWSTLAAATGYYVIGTNAVTFCVSQNSNTVDVSTYANPTITTDGNANPVCYNISGQTTTLTYSATTNSPTSYSIIWNSAAHAAGLADQGTTVFAFAPGGGSLTGISITAGTVAGGPYSGTMTITNANGCIAIQELTVTVNDPPSILLSSALGTDAQTVCLNSSITNITYAIGGGATGATVTGLPSGVTGNYSAGIFTISGSSTVSGTFNYTVTTTGSSICTAVSVSGNIYLNTISPGTISKGVINPGPDCATLNPNTAGSSNDASGSGAITYSWEQSTDNQVSWQTANGNSITNYRTFNPDPMNVTTSLRRVATSTLNGVSCSEYSNILEYIVYPLPIVTPIQPPPPATLIVCANSQITLSNATLGGVWSTADASIATVSGGVVTGVAGGSVLISYTVTDINGCSKTVNRTVNVNPSPTTSPIYHR